MIKEVSHQRRGVTDEKKIYYIEWCSPNEEVQGVIGSKR